MKRTDFLRGISVCSVSTLTGCAHYAKHAAGSEPRPNMIFLLVDDLAYYCVGENKRYPFLKTPEMDRLFEEGTVFNNAFVTTSLCGPSRASLMTGTYASVHGVIDNQVSRDFDPSLVSLPKKLQEAGYETAFIGKWHMAHHARPRPNFDYWLSFEGQGDYFDPVLNENGNVYQQEGYMTDILTEKAMDYLRTPKDRPFCLFLWYKSVHGPFDPAPRNASLYADCSLPAPPTYDDDCFGKPDWVRRAIAYGVHREPVQKSKEAPTPERIVKEWDPKLPDLQKYLRCVTTVDESVGRIRELLDQQGVSGRTALLLAGDNGMMFGEHKAHAIDKRSMWEPSLRIPMVLKMPQGFSVQRSVDQMVLNIDVAPTLLELAGSEAPSCMQGHSFVPLMQGRSVPWRKDFAYEYFCEDYAPGIAGCIGVRGERWKYIYYPEEVAAELYDLQADPLEMNNLAANPEYTEIREQMIERLKQLEKEYRLKGKIHD